MTRPELAPQFDRDREDSSPDEAPQVGKRPPRAETRFEDVIPLPVVWHGPDPLTGEKRDEGLARLNWLDQKIADLHEELDIMQDVLKPLPPDPEQPKGLAEKYIPTFSKPFRQEKGLGAPTQTVQDREAIRDAIRITEKELKRLTAERDQLEAGIFTPKILRELREIREKIQNAEAKTEETPKKETAATIDAGSPEWFIKEMRKMLAKDLIEESKSRFREVAEVFRLLRELQKEHRNDPQTEVIKRYLSLVENAVIQGKALPKITQIFKSSSIETHPSFRDLAQRDFAKYLENVILHALVTRTQPPTSSQQNEHTPAT